MSLLLFTGGGTAGHVTPNLALMRTLRDQGHEVHYAGSAAGPERELVAGHCVAFHEVAVGKLRRYLSLENLVDAFRVLIGIVQGWRLCRRLRPALVFSKGGFVSVPIVLGARLAGVPVIAHESDLTPGLATRLVASSTRVVCTSFPDTTVARAPRTRWTGTPLRRDLLAGDAAAGRAAAGAPEGRPILLVVGGSSGSEFLNRTVREALDALCARYHVLHVCGPGRVDTSSARHGYEQFEFVSEGWGDLIAAADLVISRAGANALFELLALRKRALLVPLTLAQSRGDQIENARWAQQLGLARVCEEAALRPDVLIDELDALSGEAQLADRLAAFDLPDAEPALLEEIEGVLALSASR